MLDFLSLNTYLSIETKWQMNKLGVNGSVPRDVSAIPIKFTPHDHGVYLGNHKFANEGGEK